MPHASDVSPTSHDDHDLLLVAALAADDLAADERDRAMARTRACADCANLHDDLRAIARATASVPPPIAARPRDFRLTEADAARLRPGGWRRVVELIQGSRGAVTRPLGAGLATLGLVGLLVGNVSVGIGASSAGGAPSSAYSSGAGEDAARPAASAAAAAAASASGDTALGAPAGSAAASGAVAPGVPDESGPSATGKVQIGVAGSSGGGGGGAAGVTGVASAATDATASGNDTAAERASAGEAQDGPAAAVPLGDSPPLLRPINLLSIAAIVLGLVLLVVSRMRSRGAANRT